MTAGEAPHVLVIGCGSVGRRHAVNLVGLGCQVSGFDPRQDRLDELAAAVDCRALSTELDALLDRSDLTAAVVASPPVFHVDQALACHRRGLPVLLEKPAAPDLAGARRLAGTEGAAASMLLGYTWRWWPSIRRLVALLAEGTVGRPLSARCVLSAHLADWHPWEAYQDFFMARADQGGGALLDESHFIDLMILLFGRPASAWGTVATISDLDIDADDHVDACWVAPGGTRVTIHLDLYGRPHERSITVVGTEGTVVWEPGLVRVGAGVDQWVDEPFANERNDMFVAEVAEFVDLVAGRVEPSCTLHDGVAVLEVVEALRRSSASGRAEAV